MSSTSRTPSPVVSWRDAASSPYHSSSPANASTSSSSLWTVSSSGGDRSLPLDFSSSSGDDSGDEQRCLDLLDQLEAQRERVAHRNVMHAKEARRTRQRSSGDVESKQEDVFGGYSLSKWSSQAVAGPSTSTTRFPRHHDAPKPLLPSSCMSTIRPSASSTSLGKRSSRQRRQSFTRTDICDLDIDAILDSYANDTPFEEPAPRPSSRSRRNAPSTPDRPLLPRSRSTANLKSHRHDIFPAPPVPSPSFSVRTYAGSTGPPPITHTSTSRSTKSATAHLAAAATEAAHEELFPHRRINPFPTMPRKKSTTSLRSVARSHSPFNASDAPPLPPVSLPPPTPPTARPRAPIQANRAFSSFARQSTCSTSSSVSYASTGSASSSPPMPQYPFLRQSYQSSIHSSSASSSRSDSIRWSVATSSTAPSSAAYSDAGDACSRRGSVMYSPSLSGPASPQRRGSALRFGLVDEATHELDEDNEDEDDLPLPQRQRRGVGGLRQNVPASSEDDDDEAQRDTGGLISWEDFASELEALAPPPTAFGQKGGPVRSFATSTPPPLPLRNPARQNSNSSASPFATVTKRPSLDVQRSGGSSISTPAGRSLRGKLSFATLRVR